MRYIQHPETRELIPAHEYEPPETGRKGPSIQRDIKPYQSVIDGSWITSRSHHRAHLKANNCIEVGNERPKR